MPIRDQSVLSRRASLCLRVALALALLLVSAGCVGRAWKQTLAEDTPAAYYRFMREHGDSKYEDAARERLDFHKLKRNPSLSGFEAFERKYPGSELIAALHPALEQPAFDAALARGTAPAYRAFLESFARGKLAARAEGNAVYIEAAGFGGDAARLASFAAAHPESDFSAEAKRTAEAVAASQRERIDRIGLVLNVAADTPERKRVYQTLLDRTMKLAEQLGIQLISMPARVDASQTYRYPAARLEIRHAEAPVETAVRKGEMARPAMLGVTQVVLREKQGGPVIAEHRFELRVDDKAHVPGTSVLFSANAPRYWDEFFVPAARWRNDRAIRPPIELGAPVVDVDAAGDRAVVLYEDGDFDLIGLADPVKPVKLVSYQRGEDFKKWSGVRVLGDRIAIYGEEGLELVRFGESGPVAEATWGRGEIGRVLSIAPQGDKLVVAGAKGMQLLDPATGEMRRVMRRVIQSVGAAGDALVFVDGESVYVSTIKLLAENRVIAQMTLGKTFGPNNVQVHDRAAIVTGPGGALVIDVANPQAPKALAKLSSREVGEVVDATRVRGRTFLVGKRGIQLLTRRLDGVEETIDVGARDHVAVMGRHLVSVNRSGLQVVDASPWSSQSTPAALQ